MIERERLYRIAIEHFGEYAQENQCIEECAELIQAINKKHRGKEHNIAEEIADVIICLEQLVIINGCQKEVIEIKQQKLDRLENRLDDELVTAARKTKMGGRKTKHD